MTVTPPTPADGWDATYQATPPWDIDRPQPALAAFATAGGLHGRLLDVGCGTGEHVLLAASLGLDATGVDIAPTAIRLAQQKAAARGVTAARFVLGDILSPTTRAELGGPYDTITDSGVFHTFTDDDRPAFVSAVRSLLSAGGRYVMLVFSDAEPGTWGPRRISRAEIRTALADGWQIESIEPVTMEVVGLPQHEVSCWLTLARAVD
ncbi:SAM-dependent methyltransferase [Catellatospora sp. TT07R-123]|uniref:SAM-dependent methyltransferase n=1 Tax=Catellatospora sp. TT07R-123 TaxID=2733863 RepID=UPI001B037356|nr:class I SAM-dependent methyltransferase [Catellatospora sp. TT07R-123]GHJ48987.1 SAM-dependent methyltransferase [Catellatospora sp. TT07R-123]